MKCSSYYSSLTKLLIPSILAAINSDNVTIAAGKPVHESKIQQQKISNNII